MNANGHDRDILKVNGDGLPNSLRNFMLEHFAVLDEPIQLQKEPFHSVPPEFHRNVPVETTEGKTLKAMLDGGMSLDEAAAVLKSLGENSTGIPPEFHRKEVKDPVADKRRAYDRERKRRKKLASENSTGIPPEHKNGVYISSLTSLLKEENTKKEEKKEYIHAREEDFDRLWRVYPRRLGANPRKPAWDKFKIAIKNGATPEEIISGAERYADECKKTNIIGTPFINQLVVWLNQHRWKDYQQPTLAAADFNSEEYQAARRRALDAIKGT